jgi:cell division protein ZapA (FtsZ GTPase activity inhibitor)
MAKQTIEILGQLIEIEASPGDELHNSMLARYLEEKLIEVQRDTGIVDSQKLAILAALNIADELSRLKESKENVSGILDKKAEEFIKLLDTALTA